jgi:hypothetical protein
VEKNVKADDLLSKPVWDFCIPSAYRMAGCTAGTDFFQAHSDLFIGGPVKSKGPLPAQPRPAPDMEPSQNGPWHVGGEGFGLVQRFKALY